jgi:hypothetical protein
MPAMKRIVAIALLWGYLSWYVLSLSAQVGGPDALMHGGPWVGALVAGFVASRSWGHIQHARRVPSE